MLWNEEEDRIEKIKKNIKELKKNYRKPYTSWINSPELSFLSLALFSLIMAPQEDEEWCR